MSELKIKESDLSEDERRFYDKVIKFDKTPVSEPETTELHLPYYNYVGPGTNVVKRLELKAPGHNVLGFKTGSGTQFFPINIDDMVAFEHDLYYAIQDKAIRRFADAEFLGYNTFNKEGFIKRLIDLGIKFPEGFNRKISSPLAICLFPSNPSTSKKACLL